MDDDDDDVELLKRKPGGSDERSPSVELDPSPSMVAGPVCPICSRTLDAGTSNVELNEHIDLCLNHDAFGEEFGVSLSPPKKRPAGSGGTDVGDRGGKKKRRGGKTQSSGSVLDWLKRSQQ